VGDRHLKIYESRDNLGTAVLFDVSLDLVQDTRCLI
jgi:hypothetical protein